MNEKLKQDSENEGKEIPNEQQAAPQDEVPISDKSLPDEKPALELAEMKDRYLRLAADFDNYKKISQRETHNSVRFANESLINNLLPVVDNLEQAIIAQKKSREEKNDILVGVEMVLKQLLDVLSKFGVEPFAAIGLPFDPARHEALSEQESDTEPEGSVVVEYQKGYLLNGRLLRPARVAVAKKSGSS